MSDTSSSDGEDNWIHRFCGLEGNEMFCEIDKSYIEDSFNLFGLRHWVPNINDSLDVILDRVSENEASHELLQATGALYGLIHARYVLTTAGLEAMYAKYTLQEFGNCPHFLCRRQPVVPLGLQDEPHIETVKLFCPKCQDVYVHPSHAAQGVDGAYFGTTFPHLFFMTYKGLVPDPPEKTFVPRVFGFRVYARDPSGGDTAASGQGEHNEQRLQERRRLRRPHPPQSPSQQTSRAVAHGAAVAVAGRTGSSPPNGEREAGAGGEGEGRAKAGGKGGSVVVRIKEEEELNETGTRTGKGAEVRVEGGSVGARAVAVGHVVENGNQANPTLASQSSGAGMDKTGGHDSPAGESGGGGDRKPDMTRSGKRRATDASGATANGVTASSHRGNGHNAAAGCSDAGDGGTNYSSRDRDAAGAGTMATVPGVDGKAKYESSEDNGGGTDGPRREAEQPAGSGDPRERGTKRFSEVELEAAAVDAVGGDAGARGVVLRARGKAPRGRNLTAPAASEAAAGPAGSAVVEGRGGDGSDRRKTRGRSPM